MTSTLVVLVGDTIAGALERSRNGRLTFVYAEDYQARGDRTPLSLSMSPRVRVHQDAVVTPWLWGLLPDNDAVLQRWARRFQVSLASPFGLLASPVGLDCAGAVAFVEPDGVADHLGRPGTIEWLTEDDVARRLAELRSDAAAWLGADFAGRFSLAGAQAKTALFHDGRRWGLPVGRAASTHILKPAIAGLDDHDLNEHVCLRAAAAAGLPAVRTDVGTIGGLTAVVVERYDRVPHGTSTVRIHQEDACQALGVAPSAKYQADGGPGPTDVARLLRGSMPAGPAEAAVRAFADALVWNWVIAATDAHAKNYSVLLAGPNVRLAPLYDIASALPYGVHPRKLTLAMKLGDDYRLHTQRPSTWTAMARQLRIPADELVVRARRVVDVAPDAVAEAAASVRDLDSPLPPRLTDAVAERARWCATTLGGAGRRSGT
ncbi:MAG TPA: type II toxin-antitoxin system HipA family toxin [Acidimicrobiales bacterium]